MKGKSLKLHLGAGGRNLPGYINSDINHNPGQDMVLDAGKLPYQFKKNSFFEVYSSHMIEHLEPKDIPSILKEWYRILKPWGKVIVEFPDIDEAIKLYTQGDLKKSLQLFYGEINYDLPLEPQRHKYGYNTYLMVKLLEEAGFSQIERVNSRDYHLVQFDIPTVRIEATKI